MPGGTGTTFNWDFIPADLPLPVILAGGLNPGNVNEAVSRVKPYAVDASSGLEQAPGHKSEEAVYAFIQSVADANKAEDL